MNKTTMAALLLAISFFGCKMDKKESQEDPAQTESIDSPAALNALTPEEETAGWALLFDGQSLSGWHLYNKPGIESIWKVEDGILVCDPLNGNGEHGDLITDSTFEDYELIFEWEIPDTGNSGVFINVQEDPAFQNTYTTGPEYQLLGEKHLDYAIESKRSGCLYNYLPQLSDAHTKPAGEWNKSRIVQQDGKVEFYLNGVLTARTDFNSSEWKDWVATSGFRGSPDFAAHFKGHIGLQLWTSAVRFRNIKIREL